VEWFIGWLIFSVVVGVAAGARGRGSGNWFVLAVLISPILAVILLALMPSLNPAPASGLLVPTPATHVKCPDCAEFVLREARVCKHCGCKLVPQPADSVPEVKPSVLRGGIGGSDVLGKLDRWLEEKRRASSDRKTK
jgi:hypothetical protein